ncbi:MAG: M23 family metallopeptidase [Oscillospiraceae bacterium]|nr:M23 family metallopeptidase [Oscillospiraceae bacterium]
MKKLKSFSITVAVCICLNLFSIESAGLTLPFTQPGSISTPNTAVSYPVSVSSSGIYKFYFSAPPMPIDVALKNGNTVLINKDSPTSGSPLCCYLKAGVSYTLLLTPLITGTCSFTILGGSVGSSSYVADLKWSYMFKSPQLATSIPSTGFWGPSHKGVDIVKYNGNGENICGGYSMYSVGKGKVVYRGDQSTTGWFVVVRLESGLTVRYLHMNTLNDVKVNVGDNVTKNTLIGYVGEKGSGSTGNHLHFDINNLEGVYSYYGDYFNPYNTTTYNPQLFFNEIS